MDLLLKGNKIYTPTTLRNIPIQGVKTITFLGITFDEKIEFTKTYQTQVKPHPLM